ncbi:hypothetical protein L9F63_013156, partial [Diploptera punctata]
MALLGAIIPPDESRVQEIQSLAPPDWNSPTKYSTPTKSILNSSFSVRIWYSLFYLYLAYLPNTMLYTFIYLMIMYLSTMFSILVDSLENSIENTRLLFTATDSPVHSQEEERPEEVKESIKRFFIRNVENNLPDFLDTRIQEESFPEMKENYINSKDKSAEQKTFDDELMTYLRKCIIKHNELI